MAKRSNDMIDDDGNELPKPPQDSAVWAVIYLLEYGRKRGFRIGPQLQVGEITLNVADLRQAREVGQGQQQNELEPDSDMALVLKREG